MWLRKISDEFIASAITEIRKKENMKILEVHLIRPLLEHAFQHMYPYILVTSVVFFLIFILAVAILLIVLRR
jgi:hypothetical protein